jgi:uncharacterized membrane protein
MSKQITKSIIIKGEVPDLYQNWLKFGNHPQFLENVSMVNQGGKGIQHWIMEGSFNTRMEWTTELTREEENKRIAWKTIEGDLKTSGQVTFNGLPQGQTEITVVSQITPPDNLVEKLATLFEDEEEQLEKDLRKFKAFAESR